MIRNAIKVSGLLALMALALGVSAASPAGAVVKLTSGKTEGGVLKKTAAHLTGVQYGETTSPDKTETTNYFEIGLAGNRQKLHCPNESVSYTGTTPESGEVENVTITPSYAGCRTINAEHKLGLFAVVTMEGCDYVFNQPNEEVAAGHYKGTASLTCGEGENVKIHVYLDEAHTIELCTTTVEPFENLGHITYKNIKEGDEGRDDITVKATVTKIPYILHGACDDSKEPTKTREDGEFFSDVTLTSPTHDITLSGTP